MLEFVFVFMILALILGAYWTMVIFPKQREFQHKQKVVRSLHVGDEVVTYGGLVGKIIDIDTESGISYLEIADGVQIKLVTAALQQLFDAEEIARNAQIGMNNIETDKPEVLTT
jgi:preprotein translocase subunit YajC